MKKLENIVGGSINSCGGIDKNYQPTGFSVQSGAIMDGYSNTGRSIGCDGVIRDHYNNDTGLSVSSFNTIVKGY